MRHALIEDNKVVNIIEIDPRNASDFKNAVTIPENIGAGIGDTYRDGRFFRHNEDTQQEEEILPFDPMSATNQLIYQSFTDNTTIMLELTKIAQEQTGILLKSHQ